MNAIPRAGVLCVVSLLAAPPARAEINALPIEQALTGAPGCEHVVDLLTRYGLCQGGALQVATVAPSPHGPIVMPASEYGDLCLANVEEISNADPACPPTYVVAVTNSSTRAVCDVAVSLVAMLGPIKPFDPTATVRIAEIPPGATVEVDVTLPIEALTMGANGATVIGFQKLLVAIDSYDRFVEVDEANNLRLVCRADVPQRVVATAVEPVVPATPQPAAPAAPAPIDSALERFGIDVAGTAEVAQRL